MTERLTREQFLQDLHSIEGGVYATTVCEKWWPIIDRLQQENERLRLGFWECCLERLREGTKAARRIDELERVFGSLPYERMCIPECQFQRLRGTNEGHDRLCPVSVLEAVLRDR